MRLRAGHTLVELAAALPLVALLLATLLLGILAQASLARSVAQRSSRNEAERIALGVLAAELRWTAGADVRSGSADSVRLRALRGIGVACGDAAGAVRWFGIRAPSADKDSALLVDERGERVRLVTSVRSAPACAGYTLGLAPGDAPGAVLVFETGTYYLRDRALRYRTGGEGRQPLTDEWFQQPGTVLLHGSGGVVRGAMLRFADRRQAGSESRVATWSLPNVLDP